MRRLRTGAGRVGGGLPGGPRSEGLPLAGADAHPGPGRGQPPGGHARRRPGPGGVPGEPGPPGRGALCDPRLRRPGARPGGALRRGEVRGHRPGGGARPPHALAHLRAARDVGPGAQPERPLLPGLRRAGEAQGTLGDALLLPRALLAALRLPGGRAVRRGPAGARRPGSDDEARRSHRLGQGDLDADGCAEHRRNPEVEAGAGGRPARRPRRREAAGGPSDRGGALLRPGRERRRDR